MQQAKPGSGKQKQEQNSLNLGPAFKPTPAQLKTGNTSIFKSTSFDIEEINP